MKKIYFALLSLFVAMTALTACSSNDDPFTAASANDDPRFLRPSALESALTTSESVLRTENFQMEVLVIPVDYTQVQWIENGTVIAEGTTIDQKFATGTHTIEVLATTTAGKTTHRFVELTVKPLDTDPTLAADAKSRWFTPGTSKTISGENIDNVTAVYVGGVQAADFNNQNGKLTFTIPQVSLGQQLIEVETPEGKFSCGFANVTNEQWVEPASVTLTLWQGEAAVTWSAAFDGIKEKTKDYINMGIFAEGHILRIYVSANTGNAQGAATTAWWNNFTTCLDGEANRGDVAISGDQVLEYTFTQAGINKLAAEDGLLCVGDGYTVKKITIEKPAGETTIWTGEHLVTWSAPFNALQSESVKLINYGTFAEGKILRIYTTAAEDGAQGAATTAWWNNFTTGLDGEANRGDIAISGDQVLEYTFSQAGLNKLAAEDGLLVVGNGYKVTKVTIE